MSPFELIAEAAQRGDRESAALHFMEMNPDAVAGFVFQCLRRQDFSTFAFVIRNALIDPSTTGTMGETLMIGCAMLHRNQSLFSACRDDHVVFPSDALPDMEDRERPLLHYIAILLQHNFLHVASPEKDKLLVSPLHYAARFGCQACVRQMILFGTDVDMVASDGASAIMYAAYHGMQNTVQALVDAGANLHIRSFSTMEWTVAHGNGNRTAFDYAERVFECANEQCYCHGQAQQVDITEKKACAQIISKAAHAVKPLSLLIRNYLRRQQPSSVRALAAVMHPSVAHVLLS